MLGLFVRDGLPLRADQTDLTKLFQYADVVDFRGSHRGAISRQRSSDLARSWWRALNGSEAAPLIITFEYYEDAFEQKGLSFSVDGTFAVADNASRCSVYRILDFATFKHFVGLRNEVQVFDIVPGSCSLDSCAKVRHMADNLALPGALLHTPWFLVWNGGEIDTNHALFVASEHSMLSYFLRETAETLDLVSIF